MVTPLLLSPPAPLRPPLAACPFPFGLLRRPPSKPSCLYPPIPSSSLSNPTCRPTVSTTTTDPLRSRISSKRSRLWRVSAAAGGAVPPDTAVEQVRQAIPAAATTDGISSTIISTLLTFAFVGLTILTIGVVYIAVTDFLQKREREKFEKEEAEKKKKGKKKVKVKARAGPRGFGQKIEEDDDGDD